MDILIVKLGADGDVLRTLPILKAIKRNYPESRIEWVVKGDISEILKEIKEIDKVHSLPFHASKEYDILYNFDMDDEATMISSKTKSHKKYGFYKEGGYVSSFNMGAEYYLNTVFDDETKKKNKKTYQEMIFEVAGLEYEKNNFILKIDSEQEKFAENFILKNKLKDKEIVGIHIGASSRWPSKVWADDQLRDFIVKLKERNYEIILFGGPNEKSKHEEMSEYFKKNNVQIYRNDPLNSKREFMALVAICNLMVCSDSFALHLSIALNTKTVGLFFCTSPYEVESYSILTKVVSPLYGEFFPEKMNVYDKELTNSIRSDEVVEIVEKSLNKNK